MNRCSFFPSSVKAFSNKQFVSRVCVVERLVRCLLDQRIPFIDYVCRNCTFALAHACSTHDLEEMFWGMLSPGEMARNHLKTVVKSIDAGETGKVGLRELITFMHTRQGGGKGIAGKTAETGLRRCVRLQSSLDCSEDCKHRTDHRSPQIMTKTFQARYVLALYEI